MWLGNILTNPVNVDSNRIINMFSGMSCNQLKVCARNYNYSLSI